MNKESRLYEIGQLLDEIFFNFICDKFEVDPFGIPLEKTGRIDVSFVDEYRD